MPKYFSNSGQKFYIVSSTIKPEQLDTSHFHFLTLSFVREVPCFCSLFLHRNPALHLELGVRRWPRRRWKNSFLAASVGACVCSSAAKVGSTWQQGCCLCVPTLFLLPYVAHFRPMSGNCYSESVAYWVILPRACLRKAKRSCRGEVQLCLPHLC